MAEAVADKTIEEGGARAFNDDDASALLRERGMTASSFISRYGAGQVGAGQRFATEADRQAAARGALNRAELATGSKVGSRGMRVAAQKFRVAHTNTAYEAGAAGLSQMQQELMELQADGLATAPDVAGWMKANRGRADYSANSFAGTMSFVTGASTATDQLSGAFKGADPRDILGSHQRGVEGFAAQAKINLDNAIATADPTQIDKALADVASIHSSLSSVSANKGNEFADTVFGQPSGLSSSAEGADPNVQISVREAIDEARRDPSLHTAFHDRSREYGSGADPRTRGPVGGEEPPA